MAKQVDRVRVIYTRPTDWNRHDMGGPFTGEPAICSRCDLTWYRGVCEIGTCDPTKKGKRFRGDWSAPDHE